MVKKGVPMPKVEPSSYDVIAQMNSIIAKRTHYGVRRETVTAPSYIMGWSNAGRTWYIARAYGVKQPGDEIELDANYIIAPYRAATLEKVIPFLNDLPLFKFSFEAEAIKFTGPITDDEWIRTLERQGKEVWDGQYPSDFPQLKNIHLHADKDTLKHLGGGSFEDKDRYYDRADNPYTRHRFYTVREREKTLLGGDMDTGVRNYGPPETAAPEMKEIWRNALKETEAKYPVGHPLLVAEAKRAGVSQEETQKMIAHEIYLERARILQEKWREEYRREEPEEPEESSGSPRYYQRGADGYPIGSDKIMRDAWGPIPNPDQPFWSGKGFVKPVKIYGWQWDDHYHSWRAYVRFPDGTETWTSPRDLSLGSPDTMGSPEARQERLEEWTRMGYTKDQAEQLWILYRMEPLEEMGFGHPYRAHCRTCNVDKEFPFVEGTRSFIMSHKGHDTWIDALSLEIMGSPEAFVRGSFEEGAPLSEKCTRVIEELNAGRVSCASFSAVRRSAACISWQLLEEGKVKNWREGIREGWRQTKAKCQWSQ